ncbi:hypothetical protein K438DRAFT_1824005 [Mycena galopus ATCC 62051]|nr:hypothetical protein K438DRAFT_1824005 [Mycena galopus ATCC 62051]
MTEEPSSFANEQPGKRFFPLPTTTKVLIVLCEIASIPSGTLSTWVLPRAAADKSEDEAIELDARVLARECLKAVGKEMGVRQ